MGAARERVVIRRKMQARCNRANKNYPTRARKARTRFKGGGRRFAVGPMARSARVVSLSLSSSTQNKMFISGARELILDPEF